MKTPLDPRHKKRIQITQELFSVSFQNDARVSGDAGKVIKKIAEIDPLIEKAAPEFPLDKIAKVDLAILRLAIFELIYSAKEPPKVIIDEAVELAKSFGGEGSPPFVNGVLGTILENMKKE